jgi:hypothetical protein
MNIDEIDYYELCLDEGGLLYANVYPLDKDDFNQWIRENIEEFITIENYDIVTPENDVLNQLNGVGYEHIHYQCHYSAKAATILNENFRYYTGFVNRASWPYPIITHSFNTSNGAVIDFARVSDPDDPIENQENSFPHTYYGISIPREFVQNYELETFEDKSMNPLLIQWYLENN